MQERPEVATIKDSALWASFMTFLVVMAIGILNSVSMYSVSLELEENDFQRISETFSREIEQELLDRSFALDAFASFIQLVDQSDRDSMVDFAHGIQVEHSDIHTIRWLPLVEQSQRKRYEKELSELGLSQVFINGFQDQKWQTSAEKTHYFPVDVEVSEVKQSLLEKDLLQHPAFNQALDAVLANFRPRILVQENPLSSERTLYYFDPVFERGFNRLQGIVMMEVSLDIFLTYIQRIVNLTPDIAFQISEISDKQSAIELYRTVPNELDVLSHFWQENLTVISEIKVLNSTWEIRYTKTLAFSGVFSQKMQKVFHSLLFALFFAAILAIMVYSILSMISKMRLANLDLDSEKARLQSLIKQLSDAYFLTDIEGNILQVNDEAIRSSGYDEDELLGRNISFGFENIQDVDLNFFSRLKPEEIKSIRTFQTKKSGYQFPTEIKVKRLRIAEEDFLSFIISDQTVQQAKIHSLDKALKKALEAEKSKSDFLSNMSHEIRTPLHGVISLARMGVSRGQMVDRDKLISYFETIQNSGERLLKLLSEILELAKLDAGQLKPVFKVHDLLKLTKEVVAGRQAQILERNLLFSLNLDHNNFVGVFDAHKIAQVIENLLSNAIKFTPKDGKIAIVLTKEEVDIEDKLSIVLRFSIRNEGVGIEASDLETIFDKFQQAKSNRVGTGGTGLGLAICKEIIELHDGRIWANSIPEQFAQFIFEIPINQPVTSDKSAVIGESHVQ